jgi:phenylalanyl-tRNA synthetase beta chain
MKFNKNIYENFIELQDKLHQNLCRKRSLVAIGTHDLNKLTPDFIYKALDPKEIKFAPLNKEEEYVSDDLLEYYEKNPVNLLIKTRMKNT